MVVSLVALGSACSDFVEGETTSATSGNDGTTTEPMGITLTSPGTSSTSASTSSASTSSDATTDDPPTTTEPPDSSSSGTGDSSSTTEPSPESSGSSSSGTMAEPGYLDCLAEGKDAACIGTEMCVYDLAADPSLGVCAGLDCADVSECPDAPPGGDAPPACTNVAVPDGNECILDCSSGQTCPTGMFCYLDLLCVWPQQGLALQDFEDGDIPSAWTLRDEDGNTPADMVSFIDEAWIAGMTAGGDWVAVSTSWYSPAGMADDWLITPAIALSGASTLSFEARAPDPSFPDGYEVRISTSGTEVADFMANPVLLDVDEEMDDFTVHEIDLAAAGYTNQIVWIAWRNDSNDSYLLQVDDISVSY